MVPWISTGGPWWRSRIAILVGNEMAVSHHRCSCSRLLFRLQISMHCSVSGACICFLIQNSINGAHEWDYDTSRRSEFNQWGFIFHPKPATACLLRFCLVGCRGHHIVIVFPSDRELISCFGDLLLTPSPSVVSQNLNKVHTGTFVKLTWVHDPVNI